MKKSILHHIESNYHISCKTVTPIEGGWQNKLWKLTTDKGNLLVKQYSRKRFSIDRINEIEMALQRQTRLEDISFPHMYQYDQNIIHILDEDTVYMLMAYCEGENETNYRPEKSDYCYSNLGTGIIGMVIENLYKKPYKVVISEFLAKHNLNSITSEVPKNIVKGYTEGTECGSWYWPDNSILNAIGCLYSDLDGLLKLSDIFCDKADNLFIENAKGLVTINEEPKVQIATFWGKYVDEDIITHSGSTGCFSSIIAIDLKNKRSIIMMANYLDEDDFAMAFMQLKKMQQE